MAVITHFTCGLAPRTIQTINHLQINSVYSVSDTRPSAAFSYRILAHIKKLYCMLLNRHATDNVFPQLFPDTVPLLPHQTDNLIHVNISESLSDRSSFPGLFLSPVRWFGEELKPHRQRSAISCPGRWVFIIWANKHLWPAGHCGLELIGVRFWWMHETSVLDALLRVNSCFFCQ